MMDDNAPLTITGLIATILSVIFAVAAMLNSRHRRLAARNAARAKKDESDEVDDRPYKIADPFTAAPFTPAAPAAAPPPRSGSRAARRSQHSRLRRAASHYGLPSARRARHRSRPLRHPIGRHLRVGIRPPLAAPVKKRT